MSSTESTIIALHTTVFGLTRISSRALSVLNMKETGRLQGCHRLHHSAALWLLMFYQLNLMFF